MRLRRLGLDSYGNFATQSLELDATPGRINLLVAPNGAGKSVLRQAITELLFGIHPQTPMGFQFDYNRMRLHTEAVFPDGETISFTRRKGRTNTLTDAAGQAAHPSLPDRLPRESERKRLERLFVLDSARLRDGGKALLQTDGDLADALLSSAGDLGSARALAADLAERRDNVAPRRRRETAPFYKACDEWTAAGTRLAETVVRPPTVAEHERERAEAVQAKQAANAQANDAAETLARLNRVRSTRRHLTVIDEAAAWLIEHRDAPLLPPRVGAVLAQARQAAEDAAREEATARELAGVASAQLAAATVDEAVLEQAAAIDRLVSAGTQSEQSRTDIPKRQAELDEAESAIVRLLHELSSPADPADAASELRAAADIATARELSAAAVDISAARTAALGTVERAREAIAAAEEELAVIAEAMGELGAGWFQLITDFDDPADEFHLLRRVAERGRRPMSLTLAQREGKTGHWKLLLDLIAQANADGITMYAQVMGRPIGLNLGFQISQHPFVHRPSYKALAHLPWAERAIELAKPDIRAAILAETTEDPVQRRRLEKYDRMFVLADPPDYEPELDQSIAARADALGLPAQDHAYDTMLDGTFLYRPITNYVDGDLNVCGEMMEHPNALLGLGDGGAHLGIICDSATYTHTVVHWTRDRTRGPKKTLPWIIQKLTRDPARAIGLHDRGILAPGYKADINIIDYAALKIEPMTVQFDLPSGGRRLMQESRGYVATLINGEVVTQNGAPTGALPGRLVRGPQHVQPIRLAAE